MRAVLHIGTHKTGTSALQLLLRKNRDEARSYGVEFPAYRRKEGEGPISHNSLFEKLASGRPEDVADARRFIREARGAGGGVTFFSSEEVNRFVAGQDGTAGGRSQSPYIEAYFGGERIYWDRRAAYIDRVREAFGDPAPEIWVTLRRQDMFCMSIHQQLVQNRPFVWTIDELARSDFALFDYERLIGQWVDRFPVVRAFVYEDMMAGEHGALAVYLRELGLEEMMPRTAGLGRVNISLDPFIAEFLRRVNYFPVERMEVRRRLTRWRGANRSALPRQRYVTMTDEERQAINARFRASNARLKARIDIPTPGRETLFDERIVEERELFPGLSREQFDLIARGIELARTTPRTGGLKGVGGADPPAKSRTGLWSRLLSGLPFRD